MTQFENVTVVKKANVYFEGAVTSRTILLANGEKKTLGIMMPGDYVFSTAEKEIMEILAGSLDVNIVEQYEWTTYNAGDTFEVPANTKFELKVHEITDYCCSYVTAK